MLPRLAMYDVIHQQSRVIAGVIKYLIIGSEGLYFCETWKIYNIAPLEMWQFSKLPKSINNCANFCQHPTSNDILYKTAFKIFDKQLYLY